MWYFADEDITIPVDYIVEGEYITPQSAVVSLRNNSGVLDLTINNQTLDVTTTSTSVTIPAAKNSLDSGASFSNRYVKMTFIYQLKTYHKVIQYSLIDFVPMTGTPDDVRSQLGLDDVELPDQDVDLNRAYFDLSVQESYELSANLISGTRSALVANEAIVLQAALNLVPSLRLRVASSMESEDSKFRRFGNMDFDQIEAKLRSRQTALLTEIDTANQIEFDIFGVSIPTDPVTNA